MPSSDDSGHSAATAQPARVVDDRHGSGDDDLASSLATEPWKTLAARLAQFADRPVLILDADFRIVLAGNGFSRLLDLDEEAALEGVELSELMSLDTERWVSGLMEPQRVTVGAHSDPLLVRAEWVGQGGASALVMVSIESESTRGGGPFAKASSPGTEHSYLTDRDGFAAAIQRNLDDGTSRGCALLLVDVERFETISDALGRAESDQLLLSLVGRLQAAIGSESVACRFAGHEIAILVTSDMDHGGARQVAQSIITAVNEPFLVDDQPVRTRVNVGGTVGGEHSTVESMLREADVALSQATVDGTGVAIFDQRLRKRLDEMSRFEGELRLALAAGRMELHYQPEVDLRTGQTVGVEALVRWPHPVLGVVPADRFVELTEVTGLATELGKWVLGEACATLAGWLPDHSLSMKVNVSAGQLVGTQLADEVAAVLAATGVEPGRLCLEITETSVMTDLGRSLAVLEQLTELGVQLAIDDFGTGFSSLAYLKDLPVDILKIDRVLVADVAVDDAARAILAGILTMANSLDLGVVAEGVETEAQRLELLELGCRRAQGHLFSNPLDRQAVEAWLRA